MGLLQTDQADKKRPIQPVAQGRGADIPGRCPTPRRSIATAPALTTAQTRRAVRYAAPQAWPVLMRSATVFP